MTAQQPLIRDRRNECYACKHMREVPGDAHISCANPDPAMRGSLHGIMHGWFIYPMVFDPRWKLRDCQHFEHR